MGEYVFVLDGVSFIGKDQRRSRGEQQVLESIAGVFISRSVALGGHREFSEHGVAHQKDAAIRMPLLQRPDSLRCIRIVGC